MISPNSKESEWWKGVLILILMEYAMWVWIIQDVKDGDVMS